MFGSRKFITIANFIYFRNFVVAGIIVAANAVFQVYCPAINVGFWCQDPLRKFKYNGEVFPFYMLAIFVISSGFFTFLFEFFTPQEDDDEKSFNRRFSDAWKQSSAWMRDYFIGLGLTWIVTGVLKVLTGVPRPVFFEICQPDTMRNCTAGTFIQDYSCTNKQFNDFLILESIKSFPSGHTSLSFYASFFIIWYLQTRVTLVDMRYSIIVLQLSALFIAFFASLSRISDHLHFWWDVLAGFLIGMAFAFYTCCFLCKNFKYSAREANDPIDDDDNNKFHERNNHNSSVAIQLFNVDQRRSERIADRWVTDRASEHFASEIVRNWTQVNNTPNSNL